LVKIIINFRGWWQKGIIPHLMRSPLENRVGLCGQYSRAVETQHSDCSGATVRLFKPNSPTVVFVQSGCI